MTERSLIEDRTDSKQTASTADAWECALGFMDAQVLFAADELGVFDHLAGGASTTEEVAAATGLASDPTERLLTALCALGFVEKTPQDRYANSAEAEEKLVSESPRYIGTMFHHLKEVLYPAWQDLVEVLREGGERNRFESAPSEDVYADPESLRNFMDGMHPMAYRAGKEFAGAASELGEVEYVVDLGGASGAFLIALAETFPALHGTVLDLPPVRPIMEAYTRRHDLDDRISFQGGDFFVVPLPEEADAYVLNLVLHDWSYEDGSRLLNKIAEACRPGDLLVIGEYVLSEDKAGPLYVARSDLNMMVAARGRERTAAEYRGWIAEFGFELERIVRASEGRQYLIARWQP